VTELIDTKHSMNVTGYSFLLCYNSGLLCGMEQGQETGKAKAIPVTGREGL
jgi:hypothetical protein